jgi:hypothetical protein
MRPHHPDVLTLPSRSARTAGRQHCWGVRILADSVSGQAGALAATLAGQAGGQERSQAVAGGREVIFLRAVGVAVPGDLAGVVTGAEGAGRAGRLVAVAGLPRG